MDTLEEVMAGRGKATGESHQETKPEAETPAPEPAPQGPARDEQGRFAQQQAEAAKDGQQPAEAPAGQQPGDGTQPQGVVPQQALHASRQAERDAKSEAATLKAELDQMRAEMRGMQAAMQRPAQPPPAPPQPRVFPDPLADPEGFKQAVLDEARDELRRGREEDLANHHRRTLQSAHRKYGGEFEAAFQAAKGFAQTNPLFEQELKAADDLGEHILDWHRRRQVLTEVGNDPAAYRERIRQELLAEMRGTNGAPPAAAAPPGNRPNGTLPTSFATAQNSGSRTTGGYSGPLSLEDIMKR
jgi:hypothetical protein